MRLPGMGLGELVGPSQTFCGPLRSLTLAIASPSTSCAAAAPAIAVVASHNAHAIRPSRASLITASLASGALPVCGQ